MMFQEGTRLSLLSYIKGVGVKITPVPFDHKLLHQGPQLYHLTV